MSNAVAGQPVFAGSFLRQREMVLDAALLNDDQERARILVHELFHFVWLRLGNSDRAGWTTVVDGELAARARGELGWSSEWRKRELPRQVREYVCESFCDTAAWMYSGVERHEEFTLSLRWRMRRREWFRRALGGRQVVKI